MAKNLCDGENLGLFARTLKKKMEEKGVSSYRIQMLEGVHASIVSRIVQRNSSPGVELAMKIARAVGISLDELMMEVPAYVPWNMEQARYLKKITDLEAEIANMKGGEE